MELFNCPVCKEYSSVKFVDGAFTCEECGAQSLLYPSLEPQKVLEANEECQRALMRFLSQTLTEKAEDIGLPQIQALTALASFQQTWALMISDSWYDDVTDEDENE